MTAPIFLRGFVGGIDPVDLYRFTLTAAIGVRIDLTDLSADADLELYRDFDGDGLLAYHDRIASSGVSGFRDESITMLGLHPGTYFLRVGRYEGDTEYNLSITPKPLSGADLELRRTDRNSVDLGSELTYSIQLINNGPETAGNIKVTETLLSGLRLIRVSKSLSDAFMQHTSNSFESTLPSLHAGDSVTFTVTVSSFIAGRLVTTTKVTSDTEDFDMSNNILEDLKHINTIPGNP